MKKNTKVLVYGFLTWLVPFVVAFAFIDQTGAFRIDEIFFKSIMIITGALIGTFLMVKYFSSIKGDYKKEGIKIGIVWLVINLGFDLLFVLTGFFPVTIVKYFTDIGIRYLVIPIFAYGMGCILEKRK